MKKALDFFHYLFVPKKQNDYHPKSLQTDFLGYYLIFALVLTFLFKHLGTITNNILGFATDITIEKLYELTNEERFKYNLPILNYDNKLSQAAQKKAEDMFKKDYWAHYAPNGATPWQFILSNGYKYEYAGENLAKNFLFSKGVIEAWMQSESHRENLLRKEYSDVGFAVVNGILNGEETTLVVQLFGKPLTHELVRKDLPSGLSQTLPSYQKDQAKSSPSTINSSSNILSKKVTKPKLNLLYFSLNINLAFIFFLIIALVLDFYFAMKMNIIRIRGKNLAHLIFLCFILIGLFYITKGSIL